MHQLMRPRPAGTQDTPSPRCRPTFGLKANLGSPLSMVHMSKHDSAPSPRAGTLAVTKYSGHGVPDLTKPSTQSSFKSRAMTIPLRTYAAANDVSGAYGNQGPVRTNSLVPKYIERSFHAIGIVAFTQCAQCHGYRKASRSQVKLCAVSR
jgi:hypothetical protein